VVSLLLDQCRASVRFADNAGDTPLHTAAKTASGSVKVVQLLLACAAAREAVNSSQHTAMQEAILAGNVRVVQQLHLFAPLCAADLSSAITFAMDAGCSQQVTVYLLRQLYAADPSSAIERVMATSHDAAKLLMLAMLEELDAAE
jgi:NAD-dependent oxidoreductase involved in siderophore biosynthesis